jgi:taurine--2-oxoglutarate transaminase
LLIVLPTFETELKELAEAHDAVTDVRGRGFLWAVEFADSETGDPFVNAWAGDEGENPVVAVNETVADDGVFVGGGRPNSQTIVAPPLCAAELDIREGVSVLDDAITEVFD